MTIDEFMKEIHEDGKSISEKERIYEGFLKYQKVTIEILHEFHRVCEKSGIPYQLAYGSLLGAIRDNGQIPWDYDADVFVPYCEKERLIDALENNLDPDYYFYCPEIDPKCRHYIMRVSKKGFKSEALHVDVYYVVGAPDDDPFDYGKKILRLIKMRYHKLINIKMEARGSFKLAMYYFIKKMLYFTTPISAIDDMFRKLCSQYDVYKSVNLLALDDDMYRMKFPAKIWNTILIDLPDGKLRIPACYEELLELMYGNYKKIPPLPDRIQEYTTSYYRLKYYEDY